MRFFLSLVTFADTFIDLFHDVKFFLTNRERHKSYLRNRERVACFNDSSKVEECVNVTLVESNTTFT